MKIKQQLKFTLASLAVLVLSACGQAEQTTTTLPAIEVEVAEVISQSLPTSYEFTGTTQAPETVELRPRISGYIDRVLFDEGAEVTEGETLLIIDQAPFLAEVSRIQAELVVATSQRDLAQREFNRATRLISSKAISQEQLDSRQANLQQTNARVQSVAAALELAELNLDYTEIKAPISGRVSQAYITKGNFVQAGQSVLTSLVSTDKVFAYFDANQALYLKQANNADKAQQTPVFMSLNDDGEFPFVGNIDFIDNQLNPLTGTIRARAVFDNLDSRLIPGLFARLQVIGEFASAAILIDDKAIGTDLSNKYVLVLDENNQVSYRKISLGKSVNGLRVITEGLFAGESVVTNGLQRVRPGTVVWPIETNMASDETLAKLKLEASRIERVREIFAQSNEENNNKLIAANAQ